jgi:DNA processing protein
MRPHGPEPESEAFVDLLDAVAVSMLPGVRSRVARALSDLRERERRQGTAPAAGDALLRAVLHACHVPEQKHAESIAVASSRARAALGSEAGVPIAFEDPRYPALLTCIHDPPPVLWVRGQTPPLGQPAVAIVGSRAATPYAKDVAYRLARDLAARSVVVVSGLARGVDISAHQGCLDGGGATIAVLGSGLGRVYPAAHRPIADIISGKGCVISELWHCAEPRPEHFPLRNRIISGISLAVVVVEASEKSGSLITARCGLEQGRDVMAVPGSILSGRNSGSHSLLKDGAKVVESADDILDGLGWPARDVTPQLSTKLLNSDSLLSAMAPGEVYRLDELMELTGVTGTRLLPRLMELELAGLVTNTGAGFSRTSANVGS